MRDSCRFGVLAAAVSHAAFWPRGNYVADRRMFAAKSALLLMHAGDCRSWVSYPRPQVWPYCFRAGTLIVPARMDRDGPTELRSSMLHSRSFLWVRLPAKA